jgi:DME family drug/metabolite transporter
MVIGFVFIGLAAISWGTTGATMAVLAREATVSPLVVGWARLAIAAPCLLMAAAATRVVKRARLAARPAQPSAPRRIASYAVLGLAMAAYQVCYFRAVMLAGVSVTALLAICSAPIMVAILGALVLRERIGPMVGASLALSVAGTALLVIGPRALGEIAGKFAAGTALAFGAGASYAVYAVTAKRALSHAAPLPLAALTFSLAALFLAPMLLDEHLAPADLRRAAPLLLYLGIGPTAVAYGLFTAGLRRVPATQASIVTLLEPLTAAGLGVAVFGESLGPLGWTGAALLLTALALLLLARSPGG